MKNKTLTENLKVWRKDRNIIKSDYLTFIGNMLEELLEPVYENPVINDIKNKIIEDHFTFTFDDLNWNKEEIIDAIQDIQVFCVNETELMGYDNIKCNNEVFKHINCRKQDPTQYLEWKEKGAYGKWKKWSKQPKDEIYQPNYESCKL